MVIGKAHLALALALAEETNRSVVETMCRAVTDEDAVLIQALATGIAEGWQQLAMKTDNPLQTYVQLGRQHSKRAKVAIIVMLEMVRAIGRGEKTPIKDAAEEVLN